MVDGTALATMRWTMTAAILACLLPARNASAELPGWLASVGRFADLVVALDDGSTDDTAAVLAQHPLVAALIRNPMRPTFEGWDDAANRQRLVDALEPFAPRWVLQLDTDERIDTADAAALKDFLADGADDQCAYLLRVFRMIGGDEAYDRADHWAGRLFAYRPGIQLPTEKLHFVPLPRDIPESRRLKTTIRIQHLANITRERREDRFRKYAEVDPERAFQGSYAHLLEEPATVRQWRSRPADLPVLLHGRPLKLPGRTGELQLAVLHRGDSPGNASGALRAWLQDQKVPYVCIVDAPLVASSSLPQSLLSAGTPGLAMYAAAPGSASPGGIPPAGALLDALASGGPCPGRCHVFQRTALLNVLDGQPGLNRLDHLTDALWDAGYGAGWLDRGVLAADPARRIRTALGAIRSSWQRGDQLSRRTRTAAMEHNRSRPPAASTFGLRPGVHRWRAARALAGPLNRPGAARLGAALAAHVAVEQCVALLLLRGYGRPGQTSGRQVESAP